MILMIPNMEMPKKCSECFASDFEYNADHEDYYSCRLNPGFYIIGSSKRPDCPLIGLNPFEKTLEALRK